MIMDKGYSKSGETMTIGDYADKDPFMMKGKSFGDPSFSMSGITIHEVQGVEIVDGEIVLETWYVDFGEEGHSGPERLNLTEQPGVRNYVECTGEKTSPLFWGTSI